MDAEVRLAKCPAYRLRLFLSVDLAGSTQFKASKGKEEFFGYEPLWAKVTRDFYLEFPKLIEKGYSLECGKLHDAALKESFPKVWKTLGDEIIFCCRVFDSTHVAVCMSAFLYAIREFGNQLDTDGGYLDLKSSAWLADFPSPNITVSKKLRSDRLDEDFEAEADANPDQVDFLGNGIDCGFRISTFASTDRCALSLDLAFIIAGEADNWPFGSKFIYNDRHILKGVIQDRPYPIFLIDTERKPARKSVRSAEWSLVGKDYVKAEKVLDFLRAFMADESIRLPIFSTNGVATADLPKAYEVFVDLWHKEDPVETQRAETEIAAAQANGDSTTALPVEVSQQMERLALASGHPEHRKSE